MRLRINGFRYGGIERPEEHQQIYTFYELLHTAVDFVAAMLFLVGSILLFNSSTVTAGTWMFVAGSVCFGLKPTIRLVREFHYLRPGYFQRIVERAD
jgi:hypothetical protein